MVGLESRSDRAVVSHISRKTSEIWGTRGLLVDLSRTFEGLRPVVFRPRYPDFLHGAPPTPTCAAFIKESRMNFANARKLDRKSRVRLGEPGAPVPFLAHPALSGRDWGAPVFW